MRLAINILKAALAVSCLMIAACGDNSSADSQSSPDSNATAASVLASTVPGTASPSGTTIPSATQITDNSGNVWTVSGGVVDENGALAGYTANVALLLYDNNIIYHENTSRGWWSWNGSTWVSSSDPRNVPSSSGTTIPSATQITDNSGYVWALLGGVVYKNGALAGYTADVTLLLYDNNIIYQENTAGAWWSWNGGAWVSSSDPRNVASSPNGTTIPSAAQITDGSGGVWTLSGGVVYEDGALAGYSKNVALLLYENNIIYQENTADGWWSWNGYTWVSSSDPRSVPVSGACGTSNGMALKTAPVANLCNTGTASAVGGTGPWAWSCGGSNGGTTASCAASLVTPSVVSSPNGTTIPSATQITDSSGNVWTVSGGVVYENGVLAGYTKGVALLLYDNNIIYQENTAAGWWSWNDGTWASSSDPRAVAVSGVTGSSSSSSSGGGSSSGSGSSSGAASSSSGSSNVVAAGSGSVPTQVQILLQGQDAQGQDQTDTAPPENANHITIGWLSVAGASSYNIYRSVSKGGYGSTPYATVSASSAASAYSSYVSNSGSNPYVTTINSAWRDTAATNAVGYPKGSGPVYFGNGIGYTYKVSAVVGGVESPLSTDSILVLFANGTRVMGQDVFNGSITWTVTGPGTPSPLGFNNASLWNVSPSLILINPYTGVGGYEYNLTVAGFNYMVVNMYTASAGGPFTFRLGPEISGDQALLTGAGYYTPEPTLTAGSWQTIKIPLSKYLIDQLGGTNALQSSYYKTTIVCDQNGASPEIYLEWYFSVN